MLMKIAIAQINPIVGALDYNGDKIIDFCRAQTGVDLVVFPELSLTGYPPKDLVLRADFLLAQQRVLDRIANVTPVPTLVGAAIKQPGVNLPYNAIVLCHNQSWNMVAKKILLPNYNVFDEKRYFAVPKELACSVITINGKRLLLSICEDAWACIPGVVEVGYDFDPIAEAIKQSSPVDAIINISASPFSVSKPHLREQVFTHLAKTHKVPVLMAGQVGGNDQLLFDGHSLVIDSDARIIKRAQPCVEDRLLYDLDEPKASPALASALPPVLPTILAMGIRDYVEKCGAKGVLIGLSGGIDSAVCAALAVQALGHDRVRALFLPSEFSSDQSLHDALAVAKNLSIRLDTLAIEPSLMSLRSLIGDEQLALGTKHADIVDQNLQSRLRGLLIMATSNATDFLMLATSNKSELAVGYATIYGDMCGAFSPLGDVYKTGVYRMAHAINQQAGCKLIPQSIIDRPPTAELKPHQLDTDSLPEYEVLDEILFNFIDLEKSAHEISHGTGLGQDLIHRVIGMVSKSEYKRRQGPFPLMVSDKVFGDARRLPIAKRVPSLG
jgi:NAD+ synthase (glutamine-hydrolysing)